MSMLPFRGKCWTCGHDHDAEQSDVAAVLTRLREAAPAPIDMVRHCPAGASAPLVTARPIVWAERFPGQWEEARYGFTITHEPDAPAPYHAAWGEGDVEECATLAAAQTWCQAQIDAWVAEVAVLAPIDMVLHCPACGLQHIDAPEFDGTREDPFPAFGEDPAMSWTNPPHRSHLCHNPECGHIWRPADVPTNGVAAVKTRGKQDSPPPAISLGQNLAFYRTEARAAMNVLLRARELCRKALPKFNWGASALDAEAIRLLNEVPAEIESFTKGTL